MPKPKWFGIFTTRKRAKVREFERLTPPKTLRHEYMPKPKWFGIFTTRERAKKREEV